MEDLKLVNQCQHVGSNVQRISIVMLPTSADGQQVHDNMNCIFIQMIIISLLYIILGLFIICNYSCMQRERTWWHKDLSGSIKLLTILLRGKVL